MLPFIQLLRPSSWIKNLLIIVPLFFARDIFDSGKLFSTTIAFIVFCLVASSVYILNDIIDQEHDREHEKKRFRPIASGEIKVKPAIFVLIILLAVACILGFMFVPQITPIVFLYFVLNVAYSLYIKHIAIVDIITISFFYLIRIVVGGTAAGIQISDWLLLCTIFISLFLITGKRIAEFNQKTKRRVLNDYTAEFLHGILLISATLSIIAYSLYVILALKSNIGIYSIFFVLVGIIRYIYIVLTTHKSEYPEQIIISDKVILLNGLCWVILMYIIFYH